MKILTAEQMRDVDRLTTERYRIPSLLLMENAAARSAEAIEDTFGSVINKYVMVFCGKGNNGGDGAAVARQLWMRGALVDVFLLGRCEDIHGDARINVEIVRALSESGSGIGYLELETSEELWEACSDGEPDIYVDALFGTGLSRPAEGLFAEAIERLNRRTAASLVSLDIPSGLGSDNPNLIGPFVQADLTVTFTAPKPSCVLPPAAFACGTVATAAIGSPVDLIEEAGSRLTLVTAGMVGEWLDLSNRMPDAHKGDAGTVLVVAGGKGKIGAAVMTAEATLRAGAGLVTVVAPRSTESFLAARAAAEVMTESVAETDEGALAHAAFDRIAALASARDVVAIGPGIGTADETKALVRDLVRSRAFPVILDADGLNCLSPWTDDVCGSLDLPLIVTPHPAEMARMLGCKTKDVLDDRVAAARRFAETFAVITVLKGAGTLIADPRGEVFVNATGNAGMATGGSGDVLTGVIAGLLAQRPGDALGAAIAGVFIHGLAGDLAAEENGMRALLATDITSYLGKAFLDAGGEDEKP